MQMTTANQTSQPIPNLLMTAITIELQGAALVSTQEDVDQISRDTDQRVLRFTCEADGSIEAWLGSSRLNVAWNCTRLTHGLYKHPMEAEKDIRHCCHLMAMILEKAQHAVEMLVIRVQAMATARPELARSVEGIELESNDLAPATSTGGERFPVWHRLTSNHDTTAREFFDFYFNYDATAAVVTEHNPSEEFMVDVALTLMDEMDRRTSRAMGAGYGYGYEVEEPELLALLAEQEFFDVMIRIFPEPGYANRRNTLNTVAKALTAGYLTVPDGVLEQTLGELMRLAQRYGRLLAGGPGTPQGTENLDQRSMALLRQIQRHNWPSADDVAGVE